MCTLRPRSGRPRWMRETGVSGRQRLPRNKMDAGTPARPRDMRQPQGVMKEVPAAQER